MTTLPLIILTLIGGAKIGTELLIDGFQFVGCVKRTTTYCGWCVSRTLHLVAHNCRNA